MNKTLENLIQLRSLKKKKNINSNKSFDTMYDFRREQAQMSEMGRIKKQTKTHKKNVMSYINYRCNYHENVVCALVKMLFFVLVVD